LGSKKIPEKGMEGTLVETTYVKGENPSLPYIEYMTGIEGKTN